MNENELLNLLKKEIPLIQTIGINGLKLKDRQLAINVPLAPNINHKKTMFGGSIYSVCAIACYGLFLCSLRERELLTNNIVIADGNIRYLKPVNSNCTVISGWQSDQEEKDFFRKLAAKGRAKTIMQAKVFCNQELCAEFGGSFVAIKE